ncbi:hypothetical protein AGMMS50293_24930 [Spirochaetia bacterium]|nr:hypothetical protein AGMMS50293_24930 [Spirochaetia bacterium]
MAEVTGAVILAGGRSRRMGTDKALLRWGEFTFLERILSQLEHFPEVLISAGEPGQYAEFGLPVIADIYPNRGPIGGLYSALKCCRSPFLLVLSCDTPLFERGLGEYLAALASDDFDAIVPMTCNGWRQPLCAVYAKTCTDILFAQIQAGNNRMRDALSLMRTRYIPMTELPYQDMVLSDINLPEQYHALIQSEYLSPDIAESRGYWSKVPVSSST